MKMTLSIVTGMLLACAGLTAPAKIVCKETGKEMTKCCCTQKDGKYYCKLTKKTYDKCCCDMGEKKK